VRALSVSHAIPAAVSPRRPVKHATVYRIFVGGTFLDSEVQSTKAAMVDPGRGMDDRNEGSWCNTRQKRRDGSQIHFRGPGFRHYYEMLRERHVCRFGAEMPGEIGETIVFEVA
jgi:hypothetical protein